MSPKFLLVTGAAAVLTLGAAPSSAAAANTTAFREETAVLSFTAQSELVCDDGSSSTLITEVFVLATERSVAGTPSSTTDVHAEIIRRNGCTGEFQELFPPDPVPAPDTELSSVDAATVNISLELFEFSTGEPFILDLALDFEGTGGSTRRVERTTRCSDGLTTRTLSNLESRIANVEGTVALNGDDLLSGVEYFGQLEDRRTTESTIQTAQCACSGNDNLVADFLRELPASATVASATVTRTEVETESASAGFFNVEETVCADGTPGTLETSLNLSASLFSAGSTNTDANAFMTRTDSCTGETVVGFESVVDPDYDQQGANSATLNEVFELADPGTGVVLGSLDTDVVFTGTGAPSCQSSFSVMDSPPGVFGEGRVTSIDSSERVSRAATLSGSVAFEGLELVTDAQFAELTSSRQTSLTIER